MLPELDAMWGDGGWLTSAVRAGGHLRLIAGLCVVFRVETAGQRDAAGERAPGAVCLVPGSQNRKVLAQFPDQRQSGVWKPDFSRGGMVGQTRD